MVEMIHQSDVGCGVGTGGGVESGPGNTGGMLIYTAHDIARCLNRVTIVSYKEPIDIHGVVTVTASSAGRCLGR